MMLEQMQEGRDGRVQLDRLQGESAIDYQRRLVYGKLKDRSLADVDYAELSEYLYGQRYSSDTTRKMMYGSRLTLDAIDSADNVEQNVSGRLSEIEAKVIALQEERKKLQSEKIEYHRMLREHARDDLIFEKLQASIASLPPLTIGDAGGDTGGTATATCSNSYSHSTHNSRSRSREGVLVFGDEHYGAEFVIKGLNGEIINEYNTSIAESRMANLLDQVIAIIQKEHLDIVHVLNMGDFTDGVLRVGQLKKLELGIVDGTVRYMEFLSTWLNELSKYTYVKFQMVHGNHSELRLLGQPKGTFKDENMGKVVAAYIKMRLTNNHNFEFLDNPTGLIFDNVLGYNVLGIHGEVKNMGRAIRDFSFMYNVNIDYLLGGHLHHSAYDADGYHRFAIRVPSIVGTDEYALSLNKISDPGALFFVIEENVGKSIEYTIYL